MSLSNQVICFSTNKKFYNIKNPFYKSISKFNKINATKIALNSQISFVLFSVKFLIEFSIKKLSSCECPKKIST